MSRKRLLIAALIFSVCAVSTLFLLGETARAQECRIISIHGGQGQKDNPFMINPGVMAVQKGDCVVWVNWAKGEEVKVTFTEGKKCFDVTESPVDFKMNLSDKCYVTSWVALGGTSSLRFKEAGTFDYVVDSKQSKFKATGKIVVK